MEMSTNTYMRYASPAIFHGTTTAVAAVIAHFRLLPFDTSTLPLACVTTSQLCLLGHWLVYRSRSWLTRILLLSFLLAFTSGLRWATEGMPIPANLLWLTMYPLEGCVPLAMVILGALALRRSTNLSKAGSARVNAADLLWLTTITALGLSLILLFRPDQTHYQYGNEIDRDPWQERAISCMLVVASTLLLFRIVNSQGSQIRPLSSTISATLIAGLLTARLLGINGNPYWSWFALGPSLTALLTATALSVHHHASGRWRSFNLLESTKQDAQNNHVLHASSVGGPVLRSNLENGTA